MLNNVLPFVAAFAGGIVGAVLYRRYWTTPATGTTQLEREVTALSVTLSAADDVVDDETRREITERANERLQEYDLDIPVEVTNSNIAEED